MDNSEIQTSLTRINDLGCEGYLITSDNTISDVLRFLIKESGGSKEEIYSLLEVIDVSL